MKTFTQVGFWLLLGALISGTSEAGKPARAECMLDFYATFDDLFDEDGQPVDGVRSDGRGTYDAFGGRGFRLDTNGSQKLERIGDERHVQIDFSVDAVHGCKSGGPQDDYTAEHAAGFCGPPGGMKGVDIRIEHEVQDLDDENPGGLCAMQPGERRDLAFRVVFEAESSGALKPVPRNGRIDEDGTPALVLNYGCIGLNLLQQDEDLPGRAEVTRSELTNPDGTPINVWRIKGHRACLHTHLGQKLEEPDPDRPGEMVRVLLEMPFGLTIEDVNLQP